MTDYYGDDGMKQAFNNIFARRSMDQLNESIDRTRDKLTVIEVPDPTGEPEVNPFSGRTKRDDSRSTYNDSPFKPRGSNTSGSSSGGGSGSNSSNDDGPVFVSVRENRAGDYNVPDPYDKVNPETSEYADTNGDPNATVKWSTVTSAVTGETYYKRPIRGIV